MRAEKPLDTVNAVNQMTYKANKAPEGTSQIPVAEPRPVVHSGYDDHVSAKLPPGCTEPSIRSDDVNHSWVLNSLELAFFRELDTNEDYEYVTLFLRSLLIQISHHANIFLSMQSVLFLQVMVWVYVTSTAVNENDLMTDLAYVQNKAL